MPDFCSYDYRHQAHLETPSMVSPCLYVLGAGMPCGHVPTNVVLRLLEVPRIVWDRYPKPAVGDTPRQPEFCAMHADIVREARQQKATPAPAPKAKRRKQ